ncbi:hypothetical protein NEISUBOT_03604 [Neisseria subflava NJ9703]|uniref:Uncharacterized protein n=1 Tax=Neisseria subflava NJ9703 TaxID=546268 RepID=A0A9W5IS45_NEISU|nr:hypothetical protein NEISUBOT_03604 [Neisseria subflava NJ9703]
MPVLCNQTGRLKNQKQVLQCETCFFFSDGLFTTIHSLKLWKLMCGI